MKFYNLSKNSQVVDYSTAVRTGLGENQGLFFPKEITPIEDIDSLLQLDKFERNFTILRPFVGENLSDEQLRDVVVNTFGIPVEVKTVNETTSCLELFHGPTLAFKDFGATFMANCLKYFSNGEKITILTATSGDTGAAVAHAFYGIENIEVVILYPKNKISELQEKMFTTLGGNIRTIAIEGTFDNCQSLVKKSFDDRDLVKTIGLNSANSINISRLLAQVCYYFEAFAHLPQSDSDNTVVSVPSGNFGNLTAGIIAKLLGLPIKRFIATTNANDTVPRYLTTGEWHPKETVATLSNAMDVSEPNNWPRIEYMIESGQFDKVLLTGDAVNESTTQTSMRSLQEQGYVSEPHASVAYQGLVNQLQQGERGLFLGTAHPAKFKDSVDKILDIDVPLPKELARCVPKEDLSVDMAFDFEQLKTFLNR
ncbi:MAG: threonine synthase [Kangiellaceae bacterium]|nr:threonine synthase [Kangiellaceae bacterium]